MIGLVIITHGELAKSFVLSLELIAGPQQNIEVIGGVNLPMLLKLIALRSKLTLQEAVEQAQEAARKHIHIASSLLVNQNPLEAKAS